MIGHGTGYAFQPVVEARGRRAAPELGCEPVVAEREWGLTAGQVVLAVLAILAVCEVIGLLA